MEFEDANQAGIFLCMVILGLLMFIMMSAGDHRSSSPSPAPYKPPAWAR